jgi:hypothetical protein
MVHAYIIYCGISHRIDKPNSSVQYFVAKEETLHHMFSCNYCIQVSFSPTPEVVALDSLLEGLFLVSGFNHPIIQQI